MAKSSAAPATLPWHVEESGKVIEIGDGEKGDANSIAIIAPYLEARNAGWPTKADIQQGRDNATFIVTACNAHQALYEALSAAKKVLELRRDAVRAQLYSLPSTDEDSVSAAKDNLSAIIGNLTGIIEKSDAALADAAQGETNG